MKSLLGLGGLGQAANKTISASVFTDMGGALLRTVYYDSFQEISRNITVNTIISKQSSIVNEAALMVKEKLDGQDVPTKQPQFLQFLDWIENPNSYPFPRSRANIFKYILSNSYKKGIFGVIYVFDKNKNFKHIKIPQNIMLQSVIYNTIYTVYLKNKSYNFNFDPKYRNFALETKDEILILQVGGNFDNELQNYAPLFNDALPYILLQNYLIDFAGSFHQNACFPSQVVTLTYTSPNGEELTPNQKKEFDQAVKDLELQLQQTKGAKTAGGNIMAKNPNIKITVTPLSIPTNANDNVAYQEFVSQKLYATVDGGSVDAFEGKSEYSNNASAKLQDLYDGSFRLFNSLVIDQMTQFMRGLIGTFDEGKTINVNDYYLVADKSNIAIYQKQFIAQDVMLSQNNIIKINEARKVLSQTTERYSFITATEGGDVFNAELSGNKTKPPVEVKGIDTKPTEEMARVAARALEWRKEFNRGGTAVGVARANQMVNRENLSGETIQRMVLYFARHEVDKKAEGFHAGEKGFPSAGRIAWDLWSGDQGRAWAIKKLAEIKNDEE